MFTLALTVAAHAQFAEQQKLTASDAGGGDFFGNSLALSGQVVVVGAWQEDGVTFNSGSAYVYRFNGATWLEEQKLIPSDGGVNDEFGVAVAVSGDVAVVGAHNADGPSSLSGAAYVYRYDGAAWIEEQKLTASDGEFGDRFGSSVAISGEVVIVGARLADGMTSSTGAAYAYRFNGSKWTEEQKLIASDANGGDSFGVSLAFSGEILVAGASAEDTGGTDAGAVYVYRFNGSTWIEEQKLMASDAEEEDGFGVSVAASGEVAVVGAAGEGAGETNTGAAYVYRFNGSTWTEEEKLTASDAEMFDHFGSSVALSGEIAVLAALGHDAGGLMNTGAAYVYRYDGAGWIEEQKLTASDGEANDGFGRPAIQGELLMLGASSAGGMSEGAVYIFQPVAPSCPADLDGNSEVGSIDLLSLLAAWGSCPGCPEDLDGNDEVGLNDLLMLLSAWGPCV